jgi:putative ubiquitin-RnfH superfamily antitoxin RatB of RatAB toxin-antitoxin module
MGEGAHCIPITVVACPSPRVTSEWHVHLNQGATVADAISACGLVAPGEPGSTLVAVGIWGRTVDLGRRLSAGDRVEVYRALTVDPKTARRERFARQGARTTGLFAKQREGAKAGY